jgi:PAS domain S-box-containing protein
VLQHRFFEAIAEVSGSLIVIIDMQGHIRYFSRACQSLTGYTPAEVAIRPFWEFLLSPAEIEPLRAGFHNLRAGLFPNQFENDWETNRRGSSHRMAQYGAAQ